jgi:hypothetical protein
MVLVDQRDEPEFESHSEVKRMHAIGTLAVMLAISLFALGDVAAAGGDIIPITIINDNSGAIFVTVYDDNLTPRAAILSSQRISGFASIPISVTAGASGYGHVSWSATTGGSFHHRCGNRDRPGLRNGSVVHVRANSRCGTTATQ